MKTEFLSYLKLRVPNLDDYELCYVEGDTAFFTNTFETQWGDDWNDAPYEHNAGYPYQHDDTRIVRIKFEGEFRQPCDGHSNSPYSVEQINKENIAWLNSTVYVEHNTPAGPSWETELIPLALPRTKVLTFIERVMECDGEIYLPMEMDI